MMLTVMAMLLVTVLAGVSTTLAVGNLRGSGQAQQAGTALDAAEAGVAQATSYIRTYGVRKLACYPTCNANPWNPGNPVSQEVAGGGRWTAYVLPVSVGNGDTGDRYLVHSTGSAAGSAQRVIEVEVTVTPISLPKAIFGRTLNLGGTVDLTQISMFSTGCVYKRSKVTSDHSAGLDLAYNTPIAVHSSQIITESQGSGQHCASTAKPIHGGLDLLGISLNPCNSSYPYDQDRFGGSLLNLLPCASVVNNPQYLPRDLDLDGSLDVNGSFIKDDKALFASFGITTPALTESQIEGLKTTAQAQGSYYTSPNGWTVPTEPHSVLFFDIGSSDTVDLGPLSTSLWSRTRLSGSDPLCSDASLLVVITGGNAKMNSNSNLAASIYLAGDAPGGRLTKASGTVNHIGMLYADTLDFTGDINVSLDGCYIANPPPALFDVNPGTYSELDR